MIQAIRGMNDILPAEAAIWEQVEKTIREILKNFCYEEIRFPILEKTELFKRSIGEETDIVAKEMYTFLDKNNESLTLRPEGTACCVRSCIQNGLLHNQTQKLWYMGPYFRYERPQKGRYRQFHQCGVEIFGLASPDSDAELLLLSATILKKLNLFDQVELQINSLGSPGSRQKYREVLVNYFENNIEKLDEDSKRRLLTNPLRILDSKNPDLQYLIAEAPKLLDYLDGESKQHFDHLQEYLRCLGIPFKINPQLVRGLDYYTKTVFEWVTNHLGSQGAVCSGGRYDNLVAQLGGKAIPAVGFAIGLERVVLLCQQQLEDLENRTDIFILSEGLKGSQAGMQVASKLRDHFPHLKILQYLGEGNLKNQFKKADKSGAKFALIIAGKEITDKSVSIKFLRESRDQITISENQLVDFLANQIPPSKAL